MILYELTGSEDHPVYQALAIENGARQYDFLRSLVIASLAIGKPLLSTHVIKALNFQVITCLHTNAGEFRPCPVTVGDYRPPEHYQVQALMDDFVNTVNRSWEKADPVGLSCYVLWRLNHIHPFINGNGRTARAAAYFVLNLKLGGWLIGAPILPDLIVRERERYVLALRAADVRGDLTELHALITELLQEQLGLNAEGEPQVPVISNEPPSEEDPIEPA